MAQLLILTPHGANDVLPALALLDHRVLTMATEPALLVNAPSCDVIVVDTRTDLAGSKSLCKILHATGITAPLLLVVTEGGLTAINAEWGADDILLNTAGPAEIDTRIRLALSRHECDHAATKIVASGVVSDVWGYDYFGGTRTVDVHVRRLRAKLGDQESVIGTVRNVGYRFNIVEEDDSERIAESLRS